MSDSAMKTVIKRFIAISATFLLGGIAGSVAFACAPTAGNPLVRQAASHLKANHPQAAYAYLNLAREQDVAEGFSFTARMFEDGKGVKADPGMAEMLHLRGAQLADTESMYKTARSFYKKGLRKEGDLWAERAEACGSTEALLMLMERAINEGRAPDARKYLEKGIDKGLPEAKFALAETYDKGALGFPKDHQLAFNWYYLAAKDGYAKAMSAVAYYFFRGQHGVQDETAAIHWYHKAAKAGHVESMTAYGWMLANGRGAQVDQSEADRYFKRALAKGDANAGNFLKRGGPATGRPNAGRG